MSGGIRLIKDLDTKRVYRLKNGDQVTLEISLAYYQISVLNPTNEEDYGQIIMEFEDLDYDRYLILSMNSPAQQIGFGTAALEFFKDYTQGQIYARPNDGIVRNDGSHLTNNAPIFVGKMRALGLIEKEAWD